MGRSSKVADTPGAGEPARESKGGPGWRKGQKGSITTRPTTKLTPAEATSILVLSRKGETTAQIAKSLGRNESTIARFLVKYADTRELAKAVLQAGAASLAERIVKKAEVREAIDVLSRPEMEVLRPLPRAGGPAVGGPGFGIQVSVGVGSCGTVVQITGGTSSEKSQQLPAQSSGEEGSSAGLLEGAIVD